MDGVAEVVAPASPIDNKKSKNIKNPDDEHKVEEEIKNDSRLGLKAEVSEASSLMNHSKRFGALRDSQRNYFRRDQGSKALLASQQMR